LKIRYHHVENHSDEAGSHYAAILCVSTEPIGDSGLAHAVEHLVFRSYGHNSNDDAKASFGDGNSAASLFQVTSLLPLTINASTTSHYTYFHCSSDYREVCLFGINYLLDCISSLYCCDDDLLAELSNSKGQGVMCLELGAQHQWFDLAGSQLSLEQLLLTDRSAQRLVQFGGCQRHLADITVDHVLDYHATFYCQDNIELTTTCSGVDPSFANAVNQLIDEIAIPRNASGHHGVCSSRQEFTNTSVCHSPSIIVEKLPSNEIWECCWWLDTSHANYLTTCEMLTNRYSAEILWVSTSQYPNPKQHWPVRGLSIGRPSQRVLNAIERDILALLNAQNAPEQVTVYPPQPWSLTKTLITVGHRVINFSQRHIDFLLGQPFYPITPVKRIFRESFMLAPSLLAFKYKLFDRKPPIGPFYGTLFTDGVDLLLLQQALARCHLGDWQIIDQSLVMISRGKLPTAQQLLGILDAQKETSTKIPKVLMALRAEQLVSAIEYQIAGNNIHVLSIKKNVGELPVLIHYGNDDHQVWEYKVAYSERCTAWVCSYLLGAYTPFLNRRLYGQSYCIAARYCQFGEKFILFSAFDGDVTTVKAHIIESLGIFCHADVDIEGAMKLAHQKMLSERNTSENIHTVTVLQVKTFARTLQRYLAT